MEKIKIEVTGNIARVTERPRKITSGTVGLPVEFAFDSEWDGLKKTAVFRVCNVCKKVDELSTSTVVPWEVLVKPGDWLSIGVFGTNEDGSLTISATEARVSKVYPGTSPECECGADPKFPEWTRMLIGQSAYELAVELGFKGTKEEWIASLKGEKGDVGDITPELEALRESVIDFCNSAGSYAKEAQASADEAEQYARELKPMGKQIEVLSGHIDSFHEYTNLSNVELDKMLLTIACNLESGKQDRCIISVNEDGLVLDRGYWFFETTRKGREVQIQGRLGSKTVFRTFSDSMIYNGFFEVAQAVPGWTAMSSMSYVSSERVATGSYALKIYDNRTDAGGQMHSDLVPVVEGKNYTATVKVSGDVGGEIAALNLWFYDQDETLIVKYPQSVTTESGVWKSGALTRTAPAGAKFAKVVLSASNAAEVSVYFDDATLAGSDGINLLKNPGFEQYVPIPGWTANSKVNSYQTPEKVGDGQGRSCVKFVDTLSNTGYQLWSDLVAVTPGVTYTVAAQVYDEAGTGNAAIYLRFFDKNGNKVAEKSKVAIGAAGEWTDHSISHSAPDNAVNAYVLICTNKASVGTVYFDNVALTAEGDPKPGFSEWSMLDAAVTPAIYSGSGAPDDSLGKDGDIYIQFEE